MQTRTQIEKLLERFFEGQTSNAEEKELYAYFASPDIPEELIPYKSMFTYFETGITEEFRNEPISGVKERNWFIQKKHFLIGLCAAVALLFFIVNTFVYRPAEEFQVYEGSYIVRNGVRITDLDQIKPELEAVIRNMEQQEKQAEQLIFDSEELEEYCIAEHILSEKYREILDDFPDKRTQREVLEILGMDREHKHLNK